MTFEMEINGIRITVTGENLIVNVAETAHTDPQSSDAVIGISSLNRWLKAARGRQAAMAEALGITTAAIPQWTEVPHDKLVQVERITGIDRRILRPDLFAGMKDNRDFGASDTSIISNSPVSLTPSPH